MQTFAILGAHPEISIAEINAVTANSPVFSTPEFAIFEDVSWHMGNLMEKLGGTQKLGSIIAELNPNTSVDELTELLIADLIANRDTKVHFGLSVYGEPKLVERLTRDLQHLGLNIKNKLRDQGRSARYILNKTPALTAAAVLSNRLIDKGAEFIVLATKDKLYVGKTDEVQAIDAWAKRDRERPRTNAKQGMLPPKLARIMLNLSGKHIAGTTVFDPFCGSGTVLMEAALLNAHHIIGSDINAQAVSDSEANTKWMESALDVHPVSQFFTASADKAAEQVSPFSVDAIVTEPYLGKPRQGRETKEQLIEATDYLTNLYFDSFSALLPVLKPGGRVVVASPVHFLGDDAFPVHTIDALTRAGFKHLPFEKSLLYRHEGQYVGRELLRFEK